MANSLMVKNGHVVCNATGSQRAFSLPTSKIRFFRIDKITKEVFSDGYYYNSPRESYLNGPEDLVIPTDFGRYTATKIGDRAFCMDYGNSLIKSLTIPEGITHIGDSAFLGNYDIKAVVFPTSLTSIGEYAFAHCGLEEVNMPPGVTTIPTGCFAHTIDGPTITSVNLGNVTSVQYSAFSGHDITSITIGADVWLDGNTFVFSLGNYTMDFLPAYEVTHNKAAGTYTYSGGVWTKTA